MVAIIGTKGILHPSGQTGSLVIEEDTTVTHTRLTVGVFTFLYIYSFVLFNGDIGPVVPGRDTDLLRQLIDAEDGTTLVAARDNQLVADSLDDVFLRLALQVAELALLHPLVNLLVDTYRTNKDPSTLRNRKLLLGDFLEVLLEISDGDMNATVLVGIE